jgi:hypothetical protein
MNSLGDIALGFSASSSTVFPSVYYTARHDGDPPGLMTLGEGSIINGTGSQTGSPRWGDYTAIDIDPTDDTTFWYINEYVPATSSIGWRLRIGAFNLGGTPTPTPTPGPITLSAAGRKVGGINTVRLTWSGASSANVDVYRDNVVIVTTANDGSYTDSTGDTGRARYTYKVCEAGTQTCSNNVRVTFQQ